ncbi:hypothetical protein SBRY_21066 [Actinacidiphila bryophytorum]|uniref:Uncharacterized protein n=1 Tax=Actinacidiphila bryophytorum TaxID=1436133 RepID=A0A9W4E8F8_9ACTN|nr:hypothetical protein SBRY_21066 [Actinacidiphila bryophytorum]
MRVSWLPDLRTPGLPTGEPAVTYGLGVHSPVTVAGPRRIRTGLPLLPPYGTRSPPRARDVVNCPLTCGDGVW